MKTFRVKFYIKRNICAQILEQAIENRAGKCLAIVLKRKKKCTYKNVGCKI